VTLATDLREVDAARLYREVLLASYALSGPTSAAPLGHPTNRLSVNLGAEL
jgi:hypothetical protein